MIDAVIPQPKHPGRTRSWSVKMGVNPWNWTHFVDRNLGRLTHSKTKEIEVFFVNGMSARVQMTGAEFEKKFSV